MPLLVLRVPFSTLLLWQKGTWTHAACAYLATHPANIVFRWMRIDLRAYVEGGGCPCIHVLACEKALRANSNSHVIVLWCASELSQITGELDSSEPFSTDYTTRNVLLSMANLCGTQSSHTQHICKYAWIVTSLCGNLDLAMTWHLRDQTPLPFLCLQIYELTWPKYSQTLTHS